MSEPTTDQQTAHAPEVLEPEPKGNGASSPTRALVPGVDVETRGNLPALATMSDLEFEESLAGMKKTLDRLKRVHLEVMRKGIDYDEIPGTKGISLLQPGSEILLKMNRCVAKFDRKRITCSDGTAPEITWNSICYAIDEAYVVQAEGAGSCNSWERKYRYRKASRVCPECGVQGIRRTSFEAPDGDRGWYCSQRSDGCNAKFRSNDPQIVQQEIGTVENEDPWDQDNTLEKMADKRAQVACTKRLSAASGSFFEDEGDDDAAVQTSGKKGKGGKGGAPAQAGAIDESKQRLVRAKTQQRAAKLLGDKAEQAAVKDLAHAIEKAACERFGVGDLAGVQLAQMNDLIKLVESFEIPA